MNDWIVFDGNVGASSHNSYELSWIEKIISCCTGSQRDLTPANGDRMVISDKVTFIIETNDITQLTPKALTTFNFVFLDENIINYEHLIERYLSLHLTPFFKKYEQRFNALFNSIFIPIYKFIMDNQDVSNIYYIFIEIFVRSPYKIMDAPIFEGSGYLY